jgi:hypothetical protein
MVDYQFVTVDSSGTNAFFLHKDYQAPDIDWLYWVEKGEDFGQVEHLPMEII